MKFLKLELQMGGDWSSGVFKALPPVLQPTPLRAYLIDRYVLGENNAIYRFGKRDGCSTSQHILPHTLRIAK